MKRLILIVAVVVLISVIAATLTHRVRKPEVPTLWPDHTIRQQVGKLKVDDVKTIVFDGLFNVRNITDREEKRRFLDGLKEATLPCDPKLGLPMSDDMQVKIITMKGEAVGPYGFSLGDEDHALGRKFALAWNQSFKTHQIPIK